MRLLYDHQIFSCQKYGGVSRYFCELIKNLPEEHHYFLSLIASDNHYLNNNREIFTKLNVLPHRTFKGKQFLRNKLYLVNHYYSVYCISSKDYDLFHPTYYDPYFLNRLKKPYVITVHDLTLLKFKHAFENPDHSIAQMLATIKNACRIISVSEHTKTDLIEILNVQSDKIDVIYHGYNERESVKRINDLGKYILFTGRRETYKNFLFFAESISVLLRKEKELKLICMGYPFTKKEILHLTKLKIIDKTLAVAVSDDKLNDLYSNAIVTVFPSLSEGFGFPILEAFANNCPICLSNKSCFPEIAGNAGIFFDPYDSSSILNAVERIIYDSDLANKLIRAGKSQLKKFSIETMVSKTLESYNIALNCVM